jgi:epoxyqueuosine reductase
MTPAELTRQLKERAGELGFPLVGATRAVTPNGIPKLLEWLAKGYAGQMSYIEKRLPAYSDLNQILDGAKSLLVMAMPYQTVEPCELKPGHGRVSRYAWGNDYHEELWNRLDRLGAFLQELVPGSKFRGVTDSAPVMEREFAQLAGLGWIGKHTLLLNREQGSWFFLATLLTNVELEYDEPFQADHCGTCRACLDACPTGAFPEPHVLDATKCISYLTIETRGQLTDEEKPMIGEWLWGCDICQDVCPWNNKAPTTDDPAWQIQGSHDQLPLAEMFYWSDEKFRDEFRHTPLWRAKRRGLLRNAAIVLGNRPDPVSLPALQHGLNDKEEIVRDACIWALEKYEKSAHS